MSKWSTNSASCGMRNQDDDPSAAALWFPGLCHSPSIGLREDSFRVEGACVWNVAPGVPDGPDRSVSSVRNFSVSPALMASARESSRSPRRRLWKSAVASCSGRAHNELMTTSSAVFLFCSDAISFRSAPLRRWSVSWS